VRFKDKTKCNFVDMYQVLAGLTASIVGIDSVRHISVPLVMFWCQAPWSRVLLEKLAGFQLVKKFPAFYGTRKFITPFTSACHLSLSWANSIHSVPPHPTSWRSILILSYHLCLSLQSSLFPSGFPTKTLYTPLLSLYALPARPISFFSILPRQNIMLNVN